MNKFTNILILTVLAFQLNSQTLSFSKKSSTSYLDKSTTQTLVSYPSDTIIVTSNIPTDTIMFYHYSYQVVNGMIVLMTNNYSTNDQNRHMLENTSGKNKIWAKFGFYPLTSVDPKGFYYTRSIVYLKRDSTIRDTVTFYLQFAPTGINPNRIEAKNPIHPNPALNEIILDKEVTQVHIIDNLGKEVLVKEISTSNKLDISFLLLNLHILNAVPGFRNC